MEVLIAAPAKCKVRAVIRFLLARKLTPVEIHQQLTEVYSEECMSVQHVRKWCRAFAECRMEVHDEEQIGRPPVSDAIVQEINSELLKDPRVTVRELERIPEASHGTLEITLIKTLSYRRVCARWVPRMLTDEHKEQRLDCVLKFLQQCEGGGNKEKLSICVEKNGDYVEK
ncbi:unnamed protein product [Parnassius mnemosyne]|uniref:Mos1 transposase HTH domain-containing protein n=1 Tax=Parnassius mnemosyne TaxID=213953 RepID=A0AAV1KAN9_9NEOP